MEWPVFAEDLILQKSSTPQLAGYIYIYIYIYLVYIMNTGRTLVGRSYEEYQKFFSQKQECCSCLPPRTILSNSITKKVTA